MAWGCLALCVLFSGAFWLTYGQALQLSLPWPSVIAGGVALAGTLALGSLQGLVMAWRQTGSNSNASALKDGAKVRLSGTLQPIGASSAAPISGRAAVYCNYSAAAAHREVLPTRPIDPHWRGWFALPCVLNINGRTIPLLGMPSLRELPEQVFYGAQYHAAAAQHLASTAWERSSNSAMFDLTGAAEEFAAVALQGQGGGKHLINEPALAQLGLKVGETTPEALLPRLSERNWTFNERLIPPGAQVTLTGIYRAHPPALDVSFSLSHPDHVLRLGSAKQVAARDFITALTFASVFAAFTLWGLNELYRQDGRQWRSMIEWLQNAD